MSLQLKVPDMACAACSEKIAKAVATLDATAEVSADLQTKWITIKTQAPTTAVKEVITNAGYTVAD